MSIHNTAGLGAPFGKIVNPPNIRVTNAGTAVRISDTSVNIAGVWLSGDTEGSGGALVVGDENVSAFEGAMRGIVIIPGNAPIFLPINNLNLLYVDSTAKDGRLCVSYLQPSV